MQTLTIDPDVVARRIGETAILVHLQTNRIYELNDTGARTWELIRDGRALSDIQHQLSKEFEVSPADAFRAIDELVKELVAEKLLSWNTA